MEGLLQKNCPIEQNLGRLFASFIFAFSRKQKTAFPETQMSLEVLDERKKKRKKSNLHKCVNLGVTLLI